MELNPHTQVKKHELSQKVSKAPKCTCIATWQPECFSWTINPQNPCPKPPLYPH